MSDFLPHTDWTPPDGADNEDLREMIRLQGELLNAQGQQINKMLDVAIRMNNRQELFVKAVLALADGLEQNRLHIQAVARGQK